MTGNGIQGELLRFDAFELDIATGELRKNGRTVKLQPQPSKVLAALVSKAGKLVSREEIRHEVWNGDTFVDFEQGLNFCIRQIRLALDDDKEAPRFIETVPRRGYRFVAAVSAAPASVEPPEANPEKTPTWYRAWLYVAVSVAVAAVGLVLFFARSRRQPTAPDFSTWAQVTHFTDSATSPALSPDGRMLAFIRGPETFTGPGQIYVKILPDGAAAQLTHDDSFKMSPVFSPDGSRIAYTVGVRWDTWQTPVLGGQAQLMLANASGLSWIDDQRLLFSEIKGGRHMAVVTSEANRANERDIYVPADQSGMVHRSALSPDGKWVLLAEMDSVHGWLPCRVIPFDGSSRGTAIGPADGHCTAAAWSHDGRWIYFSADAGTGFHIWRQEFPRGKAQQVTSGPTEEEGLAMSPDGSDFITSVGMQESTVWVHDSVGDQQISSEGNAEQPSISADGAKIYYLVRMKGRSHFEAGSYANQDLWATDLRTKQAWPVLPGFPMVAYSISPDEQYAVCSVADSTGESHLWIVSLDHRSAPEQIKTSFSDSEDLPIFTPDRDVLFRGTSAGSSYLYRWKAAGKVVERVTLDPIIELQSVSPDGRWAIAQVALSGAESPRGTAAFPLERGPRVDLCRILCFVNWSRDASFLYLRMPGTSRRNNMGKTYVVPLKRGQSLPIVGRNGIKSEADLDNRPGTHVIEDDVTPGPNESTYAFVRTTVHRNLYRIPML